MNLRAICESRHPVYAQNSAVWQYFEDHAAAAPNYASLPNPLACGPGILTGGGSIGAVAGYSRYLVQHPLEGTDSYYARLNKAACVDICGPALELLAGTVGQADSVIADTPPDFEDFWNDVDLQESSFLSFMATVRRNAAVYGASYVFVDSTKATEEVRTQADVQRQNIRPYCLEIRPTDLLNWRLDAQGTPIEILFRVKADVPGSIENEVAGGTEQYEYRYWTLTHWTVIKLQGNDYEIADEGPNQLGVIPIAALYHRRLRAFVGESLLKQSARYSQLLTNWLSNLDKTLEHQSFSQACLTSTNEPAEVGVGRSSVLHLHPERKDGDTTYGAEKYEFVSPDSAPIATLLEAFATILDMANSSMGMQPNATMAASGNAESGISRAWAWHAMEQKLKTCSLNEQTAARSIMGFASMWMGQAEFPGSIQYGTQFDMTSVSDAITNLISLQAAGLPPLAQAELRKRAIGKAMPNIDSKVKALIDLEIEKMGLMKDPVIPPTESAMPPIKDPQMGA